MTPFQIIITALVAVVGSARFTRLIVADSYPPSMWVRDKWRVITKDGSWSKLVDCPWCAAPYVCAANLGLGYFLHWPTWWYIVNCWLAASYAAAWLVYKDED